MPRLEDYNLRMLNEADLPIVLAWRNSERIRANMYNDHVITHEEHHAWFRRIDRDDSSRYQVFEHRNRPVGLSYITDIDRINGTCRWGFYLGETDLPSGGGTVMGYLAMNHAFKEEQLRRVSGEVLSFNQPSQRFFRRLGFTEEGRLRRHLLRNNEPVDIILFAMLKEEWISEHSVRVRELVAAREVTA